ncbi:MAG: succinylglutamate-semialdehyde dehydrogenase [Maricaulaceae bacterium]
MHNDVYINDQWMKGHGKAFSNSCPSTNTIVWEGHAASADQVKIAMSAARIALQGWSKRPQSERNEILVNYANALKDRKEEIATAISQDMGKPIWESRIEANAMAGKVAISIRALEDRAGTQEAETAFGGTRLVHRSHGVMAVLGPFNFPGHLPNGHIVPALLAGNVCIFKPSEQAPSVATIIADAFKEAGLPHGCFSIVQGERYTGQALIEADIDGLLFTGSVETGLHFHSYFAGCPEFMLALEMGGNNPLIAWEPLDPNAAASQIFQSGFITTGQRCSCARRVILPNTPFADEVIKALVKLTETVKIGPWDGEDNFMGPLVSVRAAEQAVAFQDDLISKGGEVVKALIRKDAESAFVTPGIIDVTHTANRADHELFGPLIQLIRVETIEDAVAEANATRFGLAGGLLCDDQAVWELAREHMKAGILNWNRPTTGASSALPFGGPGHSGNFRPGAYYAADYCAWPQASQVAEEAKIIPMPGLA